MLDEYIHLTASNVEADGTVVASLDSADQYVYTGSNFDDTPTADFASEDWSNGTA